MASIRQEASHANLKSFNSSLKDISSKETASDSIRRFKVYKSLLQNYQYVDSHPNMAAIIIVVGICLHLPSIIYYSCYYFSYLVYVYSTVMPRLIALVVFKTDWKISDFQPPSNIFVNCMVNLITCYIGFLCLIICIYLLLPIKGKYLATAKKQQERRKQYCTILFVILAVYLPYQIAASLQRNIPMIRMAQAAQGQTKNASDLNRIDDDKQIQLLLLSKRYLTHKLYSHGTRSFWNLHAYEHLQCCLTHDLNTGVFNTSLLPSECCQSYKGSEVMRKACESQPHVAHLWPHCSRVVINIASDVEITMDAQMQIFLLISIVILFVLKYSLNPHLRMQCDSCRHNFGWLGMKRPDN